MDVSALLAAESAFCNEHLGKEKEDNHAALCHPSKAGIDGRIALAASGKAFVRESIKYVWVTRRPGCLMHSVFGWEASNNLSDGAFVKSRGSWDWLKFLVECKLGVKALLYCSAIT